MKNNRFATQMDALSNVCKQFVNVWTISLFSAKPICVEFCRRTSPITIVGDRTARWAKQLHVARRARSISKHVERSRRNLCSAGYTAFAGLLHDQFLRPGVLQRQIGKEEYNVIKLCKR
jgi:hypothetical protein